MLIHSSFHNFLIIMAIMMYQFLDLPMMDESFLLLKQLFISFIWWPLVIKNKIKKKIYIFDQKNNKEEVYYLFFWNFFYYLKFLYILRFNEKK